MQQSLHVKDKLQLDEQLGSCTDFTLSFHKSGNGQKKRFKVREKSGNFTLSQGKFIFKRNKQKLDFLTNSSTLVGFYGHEM